MGIRSRPVDGVQSSCRLSQASLSRRLCPTADRCQTVEFYRMRGKSIFAAIQGEQEDSRWTSASVLVLQAELLSCGSAVCSARAGLRPPLCAILIAGSSEASEAMTSIGLRIGREPPAPADQSRFWSRDHSWPSALIAEAARSRRNQTGHR
jgi:hypothetical protein